MSNERPGHFRTAAFHDFLKFFPVLARVYGRRISADEFDLVFVQNPGFAQINRRVQGHLSTQSGQQRIWAFLGDNRFQKLGGNRFDIGAVGDLRVSHNGGGVGVDQDNFQALITQHSTGLSSRIVKFGRLTDDNRPGADDHNRM